MLSVGTQQAVPLIPLDGGGIARDATCDCRCLPPMTSQNADSCKTDQQFNRTRTRKGNTHMDVRSSAQPDADCVLGETSCSSHTVEPDDDKHNSHSGDPQKENNKEITSSSSGDPSSSSPDPHGYSHSQPIGSGGSSSVSSPSAGACMNVVEEKPTRRKEEESAGQER